MTIIFKAKTQEGYTIKVLSELLQNNIKTACFEVDKTGITLCQMDTHRTILINFKLESDSFSIYKFKQKKKLLLGINLTHFHKMLKMIKKKDSIQLFINTNNPTDLGIKVIPREHNRVTTSFVKIQDIQNIDIDIPEGYLKHVIVPSVEFQKMCKDLAHISNMVDVTSRGFKIRFSCSAGGVMKRQVDFGEDDTSDNESDDDSEQENTEYIQGFKTEQFTKITKLSGLGTNLQIYPREELPLLFRSQLGTLGRISIYLKSTSQIMDENKIDDDNSDDDF